MENQTQGISHAQWVLSLLNQQRGFGQFCDAMLSTASGQVHLAHRNVLACFSNLFQDPNSDTPCLQFSLPLECPDDGLELLIDFFYTGELDLDGSNIEKVQNAASGLSVPDSLIPFQRLKEPLQLAVFSEDVKVSQLFPLPSADSEHDQTIKEKTKSWHIVKETPDESSLAVEVTASDEDPPASTSSTTTRSGRRVKGPRRLTSDNLMCAVTRQVPERTQTSSIENTEEDHLKPSESSENETEVLCTPLFKFNFLS